jgi:2-C-methyl-D-erythritol 4-phosphate cytidylyltransferase
LGDIYQNHLKSQKDGLNNFIDSASLMKYYGHSLYTVEGPTENIKITTPGDFYIFRAIIDARENSQIFGI